jgi:serine/threonine-protein phosphatase 2A regulatory subunit A
MEQKNKTGPVEILIGELKNDDIQLRLNSIRNLSTIARALGPERAQKELIPFLRDTLDDEDEVLLALAEELSKLTDCIGGKQYAYLLLGPLESLARAEETVVREKAVESLCIIAEHITDELFEEHYIGLLKRLVIGDWFTPKSAACGIFHIAYPRASPAVQIELRAIYKTLCEEETPMVRRSACSQLKKIIPLMDSETIKKEILETFKTFSKDEQDSVRLLAVENGIAVASKLSEDDNQILVKPVLLACAGDRSWRVRYMVASHFCEIVDVMGKEITQTDLLPFFC